LRNSLKEVREANRMSQEELADISGISRTTISALENYKSEVTKTDTLVKLADVFNKKVTEIFFLE
jgi:Predicted transcriptional regulators